METKLREMNANEEALRQNYQELSELKFVLMKSKQFFDEVCELMLASLQVGKFEVFTVFLFGRGALKATTIFLFY